jgi:uncharacterized protein (TIGR00251 family)
VKDWQGGILLTVFVQPKASRTAWVGLHGDAVKIRIAASPVDGAANRELIRFLAEELSMPMSAIDIHSGACGGRHGASDTKMSGIRINLFRAFVLMVGTLLCACSGPKPVLYPNAHLQSVGNETAEQDIEACKEAAETAGADEGSGKAGRVATSTGVGAGVGAASGAVGGAISGAAGQGSLIGAASGAVWGLLTGLFTAGSSQPSQAFTNYVNRCLQERGYEVTGWQ